MRPPAFHDAANGLGRPSAASSFHAHQRRRLPRYPHFGLATSDCRARRRTVSVPHRRRQRAARLRAVPCRVLEIHWKYAARRHRNGPANDGRLKSRNPSWSAFFGDGDEVDIFDRLFALAFDFGKRECAGQLLLAAGTKGTKRFANRSFLETLMHGDERLARLI